jgi:two-component system phosphate regulon sensor histidine kinase PhoR
MMAGKRKRLFTQIFPSYLIITLVAVLAISWYAIDALRTFYLKETAVTLEARARLIKYQVLKQNLLQSPQLTQVCRELGRSTGTRITIVDRSGRVLGDSHKDPQIMDNHANRPEIIQAYAGNSGTSTRFSRTLQQNMMYLAIPVVKDSAVVAVVRTSLPLTTLQDVIGRIQNRIILGGSVVAVFAILLSFVVSRWISRPLEEMKQGAERFARGELDHQLRVPTTAEIGALAETLNQMSQQLNERIKTILQQRNEQEAVLSSMAEGVLAVDKEEKIIRINQTASRLFKIDRAASRGMRLRDVLHNRELQEFVSQVLATSEHREAELSENVDTERYLKVYGTTLKDAEGTQIGALIVLNDITRLKQLENVRREFVANVSHELKTPITSIKGAVETLWDGALDNTEDAKHFLDIIIRQSDRLDAIINDLLSLSRIEQEYEQSEIKLEKSEIKTVIEAAMLDCQVKAEQKGINVTVDCPPDFKCPINAPLLQQAIINLIDNAIKYSKPGSRIQITAREKSNRAVISVRDWGCGIAEEHLPRLFERFYRVDKARSRKLGGTGLGLAIVKHVALAHHGSVSVESIPGEGSTFFIYLPKNIYPPESTKSRKY